MNWVVVAWTALSALGVCLSLYLVRESLLDLQALGKRRNGRRRATLSRLIRETIRVSVHAGYIVAGLIALDVIPWSNDLIVPILMYGNLALIANSFTDTYLRAPLYPGEEERKNGSTSHS